MGDEVVKCHYSNCPETMSSPITVSVAFRTATIQKSFCSHMHLAMWAIVEARTTGEQIAPGEPERIRRPWKDGKGVSLA